jgi:hypothetical protein
MSGLSERCAWRSSEPSSRIAGELWVTDDVPVRSGPDLRVPMDSQESGKI